MRDRDSEIARQCWMASESRLQSDYVRQQRESAAERRAQGLGGDELRHRVEEFCDHSEQVAWAAFQKLEAVSPAEPAERVQEFWKAAAAAIRDEITRYVLRAHIPAFVTEAKRSGRWSASLEQTCNDIAAQRVADLRSAIDAETALRVATSASSATGPNAAIGGATYNFYGDVDQVGERSSVIRDVLATNIVQDATFAKTSPRAPAAPVEASGQKQPIGQFTVLIVTTLVAAAIGGAATLLASDSGQRYLGVEVAKTESSRSGSAGGAVQSHPPPPTTPASSVAVVATGVGAPADCRVDDGRCWADAADRAHRACQQQPKSRECQSLVCLGDHQAIASRILNHRMYGCFGRPQGDAGAEHLRQCAQVLEKMLSSPEATRDCSKRSIGG